MQVPLLLARVCLTNSITHRQLRLLTPVIKVVTVLIAFANLPILISIKRLFKSSFVGNRANASGSLTNGFSNGNYWSAVPFNANNSRNLNFNSSNVYPQNVNNRANGLTVRPQREELIGYGTLFCQSLYNMSLIDDLFDAYFDARYTKRNSRSQLGFELCYESNLFVLAEQLQNRSYTLSPGKCFITDVPVKREIYASLFKDRVVHHLLFNYLAPLFEKQFIYDSYSCRVGKGTLLGVKRFDHHLRSVTENYTKQAYILQLDIRGYFMSINRAKLYEIIQRRLGRCSKKDLEGLDMKLIDFLLKKILFRNPIEGVQIVGRKSDWIGLPDSKSLLKAPPGVGLPIGDLTSQLFSNIYLNELDHYVKRVLGVKHYGRYVDDFFLMHPSKRYLKECIGKIDSFLHNELELTLHPKKIRLADARYGGIFLGACIKPHRIYAGKRTAHKFNEIMYQIERDLKRWQAKCDTKHHYLVGCKGALRYWLTQKPELEPMAKDFLAKMATINSYLGIFSHYKCYNLVRRRLENSLLYQNFTYGRGYSKIKLNSLCPKIKGGPKHFLAPPLFINYK